MDKGCVKKLFFKFAIPGIMGMLIVSMQTMVDGLFLSRGVGPQGLAAVNISIPLINLLLSISLMICVGGAVLAGVARGEGDKERSMGVTSLTFFVLVSVLGVIAVFLLINFEKVIKTLGATGEMYPYVKSYLSVAIPGIILFSLPIFTEAFARVIGKPNLIFLSTGICFFSNVFFDYIFIITLNMGMIGGAIGTCFANVIGGLALIPIVRFGKVTWNKQAVQDIKSIFLNGSSEMLTVVSSAIVVYIFNLILLERIGYLAVSALTIVFYLNNILNILLFGLSQALQPIISYNLGAKQINRIKEVLGVALKSGGIVGLVFFLGIHFLGENLIQMFSNGKNELKLIALEVSFFMTFAYLISFINVIASGFHTAIGKAFHSAIISLGRSIIFILIPLFILPLFLGNKGLWLSIPVGELTCLLLSIPLMKKSLDKLSLEI